jgi:ketosteroid isomerase-like protein
MAAGAMLVLPPLVGCEPSAPASPSDPGVNYAVTAPGGAAGARAATESPQEQAVIAALKEYERAIVASDTVALKQIWAEDYTFINPQGGLVTRAERLANLASGATNVVEGVNQREIVVRVYGDNAVVTQLFTLRGLFSGVMTDREVRGSFTWIKRAGRWQLVFNEITPVVP